MLLIKRGHSIARKDKNPIIVTPEGNYVEVTFFAAFVWSKLDGITPLEPIAIELAHQGNFSIDQIKELMTQTLDLLIENHLIEEYDPSAQQGG